MTVRVEKNTNFHLKYLPKMFWDEFVYGSHLVAVGDVLVLFALSIILKINVTVSFFIVIYLSILAVNFFNRYMDDGDDEFTNADRSNSVRKYFKLMPQVMAALFLISVGITAWSAPFNALIFMLFLFGIGIFYSLFLKKITSRIIGFKNIMTALPYALLVVFMAIYYSTSLANATWLITAFYFIRMLVNTIFFDIKDIKSDKSDGLKTLPVVFGENKTKIILTYLNIFSIVPIILGIYWKVLPFYSIALLATVVYSFLYLGRWGLFNKQTTLYNVVVDGEFIFWLPYIMIWKAFV
jgi:4-hydroxybenzoate polyprenyltransferase